MLNIPFETIQKNRKPLLFLGFFLICIITLLLVHTFVPKSLSEDTVIVIQEGSSLSSIAQRLQNQGVIRSSTIFKVIGRLKRVSLKAGNYLFLSSEHHGLINVLNRLESSEYGDIYLSVTLPEGITIREMHKIFSSSRLKNFSAEEFIKLTEGQEGYLFPDTYSFLPSADTRDVVDILTKTFDRKIKTLNNDIINSERSIEDIVIMASLIEKEATRDAEEQKIVAGILWKRLDIGMLLQVDAPFLYTQGKTSSALTHLDLRTDGPYNTYTRKGLPITAIGNPGISALDAALNPIDTLYFFYLHDNNGGIHYGKTYSDHLRNKRNYL